MLVRAKKFNVQKKMGPKPYSEAACNKLHHILWHSRFFFLSGSKTNIEVDFFHVCILILPLHFGFSDYYTIKSQAVDRSTIQFWTLSATDHSTDIIITFLLKYVNNSYRGKNCEIWYCLLYLKPTRYFVFLKQFFSVLILIPFSTLS